MWLQFLGTGDAFCSGGRLQTCFLVKVVDFCFLIDCGATSLLALKSRKIDSNLIDGILITHFHGDHFGGIPYLLLDANFSRKRTRPLIIAGPPGIAERVGALLELCYPKVDLQGLSYQVQFVEYVAEASVEIGPLLVEAYPVVHVRETNPHGLRIHHDNTLLAFSGDTGWTNNLYKIADSADLFICECNFFKTEGFSHLSYQRILEELENFNCKRLILNHLGTEMLDNLKSIEIEYSNDGQIIEL